jgi:hypothetical protein
MKTNGNYGRAACALRFILYLVIAFPVLSLAACATPGVVKSGQSAVYSTGLSVTLLSWKDGADLGADRAPKGRWLTADVRVDYDGNAQAAEVPISALKLLWEALDGSKGRSSAFWVYDPTPGAGWSSKQETLRVRMSNRFTLAFDIPAGVIPSAFNVGDTSLLLIVPPVPEAKD